MASQAVVDAAIQFCEGSMVIRETLEPIRLFTGEATCYLEAPVQQQVVRVMRAFLDGREIRTVVLGEAPTPREQPGQPVMLHATRVGSHPELVLTPAPDRPYALTLDVALRPRRNATSLEDDLFNIWLDAIVAGAVSAVQRIPAQPFSDPASAAQRHAEFRSHITRARIDATIGRVSGAVRVQARPFA